MLRHPMGAEITSMYVSCCLMQAKKAKCHPKTSDKWRLYPTNNGLYIRPMATTTTSNDMSNYIRPMATASLLREYQLPNVKNTENKQSHSMQRCVWLCYFSKCARKLSLVHVAAPITCAEKCAERKFEQIPKQWRIRRPQLTSDQAGQHVTQKASQTSEWYSKNIRQWRQKLASDNGARPPSRANFNLANCICQTG